MQTDACDTGIAAVLSQQNDKGEEHPVLYVSRKLLPREVAYSTIEKECLCIIWAIQKLQPYLYGRKFTVCTDHNPLTWLNQMKSKNARLMRWALSLQSQSIEFVYKKGKNHGNADGLSRKYD